jgi:hypothetical protein
MWIVSPVVAATLPTERSARRDAASVESITGRGPAIESASGRNDAGKGVGRLRTVRESSVMNWAATRSAGGAIGAAVAGDSATSADRWTTDGAVARAPPVAATVLSLVTLSVESAGRRSFLASGRRTSDVAEMSDAAASIERAS